MNWKDLEHWLTTTAVGLIVLGLVIIFVAASIAKISGKLWRGYLRSWVLGSVIRFLGGFVMANVRSAAIGRVLTNRYIKKKDYFRYIAHTGFAIMIFGLSTLVQFLLIGVIAVYFIVNGARFSWTLLVLFSLTGFFLYLWLKDVFYFYGVAEQTFQKDLEKYKKLFPKLHPDFVHRLMTEDIEDVLKEQKATQAEKKAIKDPPNPSGNSGDSPVQASSPNAIADK
jgi:MFS family permease